MKTKTVSKLIGVPYATLNSMVRRNQIPTVTASRPIRKQGVQAVWQPFEAVAAIMYLEIAGYGIQRDEARKLIEREKEKVHLAWETFATWGTVFMAVGVADGNQLAMEVASSAGLAFGKVNSRMRLRDIQSIVVVDITENVGNVVNRFPCREIQ